MRNGELPLETRYWSVAQVIHGNLTLIGPLDPAGPAKSIIGAEYICAPNKELYIVEIKIINIVRNE